MFQTNFLRKSARSASVDRFHADIVSCTCLIRHGFHLVDLADPANGNTDCFCQKLHHSYWRSRKMPHVLTYSAMPNKANGISIVPQCAMKIPIGKIPICYLTHSQISKFFSLTRLNLYGTGHDGALKLGPGKPQLGVSYCPFIVTYVSLKELRQRPFSTVVRREQPIPFPLAPAWRR